MDIVDLPPGEAEDAHTIGHKSARRPRVELITRGERRRVWTIEQKREIVAESLGVATTPTEVSRKYAISSGLLYTWRQQVLGQQFGAVARSGPSFAEVEATEPPQRSDGDLPPMDRDLPNAPVISARSDGLIEIALPTGIVLRVDAHVDGRALRRVLGALDGR